MVLIGGKTLCEANVIVGQYNIDCSDLPLNICSCREIVIQNKFIKNNYDKDKDIKYLMSNIEYLTKTYYNRYIIIRDSNIVCSYNSINELFKNLPDDIPIGNYVIAKLNGNRIYRIVDISETEYINI